MKLFLVLAFLCVFSLAETLTNDLDRSKAHHESRMAQLERMVKERLQTIEDHHSGRRRLSDEDHAKASRQSRTYAQKLEKMKNSNTDEHYKQRAQDMSDFRKMDIYDKLKTPEELQEGL